VYVAAFFQHIARAVRPAPVLCVRCHEKIPHAPLDSRGEHICCVPGENRAGLQFRKL
jgi:hypothetical protein